MNYYRRYIGDFQRDTGHLTLIEVGAYDRLLDAQYATGKALPVEIVALYRICRALTDDEQEAVRSVVEQFFPVTDGERWNPRARRELNEARPVIEAQREAAQATNRKRWGGERIAERVAERSGERVAKRDNHQPPTTNHQPPPATRHPPVSPDGDAPARGAKTARPSRANGAHVESLAGRATWSAYSDAYRERYGVAPTRNARVNAQIAQLVQRLGAEEAPQVAGYYVTHPDAFYVKKGHAIGPLVNDCEKLRTEWATGRRVTSTRAQQIDRTGTQGDIVNEILHDRGERPR